MTSEGPGQDGWAPQLGTAIASGGLAELLTAAVGERDHEDIIQDNPRGALDALRSAVRSQP